MRRALATVTVAGAVALVPATATTASADDTLVAGPVLAQEEDDGDQYGDWGLLGLTGLFGLFGYKKYKDYRASSARTDGTDGTDGTSRRV